MTATPPGSPYYAAPMDPNAGGGDPPYPLFCKIMFIAGIVFAVLRVVCVGFGVIGYNTMDDTDPMKETVVMELATGLGIFIFGLVANIAMLCKQRWGVYAFAVLLLAVLASYGVGIAQASIQLENMPQGSPERGGGIFGLVLAFGVRTGVVAAHIAAVFMFWKWCGERDATAVSDGSAWPT